MEERCSWGEDLATGDAGVDESCQAALGAFRVGVGAFEEEDGVGVERLGLAVRQEADGAGRGWICGYTVAKPAFRQAWYL